MRYLKRTSINPLILAIIVTGLSYAVLLPNASAFSTDQAQQVLAGVQGAMVILPLGIGLATFIGATSVAHVSALPSIIISGATAVIIFIAMWSVVPTFVQNAEIAQDNSQPAPATPNAPLNLIANAVSTSEIDLSWMAPPQAVIGYKVEYSFNTFTWFTLTSNTGSIATTYNAVGLQSSTTYYFRVSGVQVGNVVGPPSNVASDITFGMPDPPTGLSYTSPTPNEIDISWIPPLNNGGEPIVGYKVDRAFPATSNSSKFVTLVANTGNVTTLKDTNGITSGTTYSYRVSTLNNVLTSIPSNILNATSDPPQISNSTGNIVNGIAVCPSTTKLLSLNATNGNGSMIIIGNTQFQTTSGSTKSVNVYLFQNSTMLEHNVMNIRLGTINTNNDYTLLFYTPNAIQRSHYQINACTTLGTVNGIAKMATVAGKSNVFFTNGTNTAISNSTDTTLASASTNFAAGTNVIVLANLGLQSVSSSTAHFTAGSFKIKNSDGTTISTNNMGLDMGGVAPSSTQYGVMVAGEVAGSSNPTYSVTAIRPGSGSFNGRTELLVFSVPQFSFTNPAVVNVGLATTPLATFSTGFGLNSTQLALGSTWYNNTSASPVQIPVSHHTITNGTTLNSNSFTESPFFNAGNFGDTFTSSLFGVVTRSGSTPTFTINADANITGTKSATQLIAFQISGAATSTPSNLKSNTLNASAIQLTWSAPTSNGGFPITGYTVMQDSGGGFTKKAEIGNFTSYTVTGLGSGTQFAYKVAALNALGNSTFSAPASNFTTTNAPTSLKALTVNSTAIQLKWTNPTGTLKGIKIYRESPVGGGFATLVANTTNNKSNYNDTGLLTKTAYNYKIAGLNMGGISLNSTSASNQTSDSSVVMASSSGVSVTSVCSTYTSILNITGTAGNNLVLVSGQFMSTSGVTKQVGFKIVDNNNSVVLAANKTSIRLNTANTYNSYLLIGSETNSPSNPLFKVYACTSGNSIIAQARAVVINGYGSYFQNTGATTVVHYYDTNKVLASVATNSAFSSKPNVIIANVGIVGNASNTIRIASGALKIFNSGTSTDISDNQIPLYVGTGAPTSSPSITLIGLDNSPGATPTYTVVANSGNNTSMQASIVALHVANASYVTGGALQNLNLNTSPTTLNTLSTPFGSGTTAITLSSAIFNNTNSTVKQISAADFKLKEGGVMIQNNTMTMRAFGPTLNPGDMFAGMHLYSETVGSTPPTYSVTAAANVTSSIKAYAKILSFILTANVPSAPQSLTQTEVDNVTTTLNWSAPTSNGGLPITGYEIDYHQNQTGSFSVFATPGNVTSYTTHARTPGYPYVWEVKAINAIGSSLPSNIVKTVPWLLSSFTPSNTTQTGHIVDAHYTLGDIGINSFGHNRLEKWPKLEHSILFCSVSTNTTNPKCGQDTIIFERNAANASPLNANPTTPNNFPIQYMWYDNEENNDASNLSTPAWEWNESTCPAGNICDPAYWTNLAATNVHSYQVGTKGYNYKFGAAPTADMNGTWQHNPSKIYCYDYVALGHHFDHTNCAMLWNELTRVNWANVEILNIQSQRWIGSPNSAHSGDNPPCDQACVIQAVKDVANWVYTNSSGHTLVGVQINTENSAFGNMTTWTNNISALKGIVNNTAYYFSSSQNPDNFNSILSTLKR